MKKRSPNIKKIEKTHLKPIGEIAQSAGIRKKFLQEHGPYKAKISLDILKGLKKKGKYVLVTSITPTPFGEGKTLTAIGLSMAFKKLKKKALSCIMQPSLGGLFGIKGTATGSGASRVFPAEDANLYLTGDLYATQAAHNLCAAYMDNSIFKDNPLDIDAESITWKRAISANDRSLRSINIGLGSKTDGISRKTGFDITASSELMSILALAGDLKDLRERIGKIVIGFTKKGKPVTCEDIKVAGAMTVLMKDAIKPNLLQTTEHTACLMHTDSCANISLGTGSIVADKIALGISDYAIVETGFGADMGAEKFFDIKCRASGLKPDAAVIVCSTRAFKMHSGDFEITTIKPPREITRENISAIERGLSNLEKQIRNLRTFGIPVVVCINRFSTDTDKEIHAIKCRAIDLGANSVAVSDAWKTGGQGGIELAENIIEACKIKHDFRFLYPLDMPIKDKIRRIARTIYGAGDVAFSDQANKKALIFKKLKFDNLPICMAKTHLSLSHNPKRKGRPHGFKFPVEDIRLYRGAGYISVFCGNVKTLPGLPKIPRGTKIDINEDGKITGLF
ncbi:MAG: formate--tetrahydrofolate ligase [Candidatus Omnitrophota bacterium]|nr:MAG: formate--tetrahydrofolate ligase [Candidatus Omnitrophota bacterium]